MKQETQSIKVNSKIYNKVKRHTKKTKQTIGGFYDLSAESCLNKDSQIEKIDFIYDFVYEKFNKLTTKYSNKDADIGTLGSVVMVELQNLKNLISK